MGVKTVSSESGHAQSLAKIGELRDKCGTKSPTSPPFSDDPMRLMRRNVASDQVREGTVGLNKRFNLDSCVRGSRKFVTNFANPSLLLLILSLLLGRVMASASNLIQIDVQECRAVSPLPICVILVFPPLYRSLRLSNFNLIESRRQAADNLFTYSDQISKERQRKNRN